MKDQLKRVYAWHDKWCEHLSDYAFAHGLKDVMLPKLVLKVKLFRKTAGLYDTRAHECHYFVPFIVTMKDRYEEVVAHECCHAFQWKLLPRCEKHGEMFHFLLRRVCGWHKSDKYHRENVTAARKVAKLLTLHSSTQEIIDAVETQMQSVGSGQKKIRVCPRQARRNLVACGGGQSLYLPPDGHHGQADVPPMVSEAP